MTAEQWSTVTLAVLLALVAFRRRQQKRDDQRRLVLALAILVSAALWAPPPIPPVVPPPPDERKRVPTPPNGIAIAPDAGVDGAASMLAVEPETRMAGETMAVDYDATNGFVMGAPIQPRR